VQMTKIVEGIKETVKNNVGYVDAFARKLGVE